jgi:hypothetical protein
MACIILDVGRCLFHLALTFLHAADLAQVKVLLKRALLIFELQLGRIQWSEECRRKWQERAKQHCQQKQMAPKGRLEMRLQPPN